MSHLQLMADYYEALTPYGWTQDGEVAPAHAIDEYGETIPAENWNLSDFYDQRGQQMGRTFPIQSYE